MIFRDLVRAAIRRCPEVFDPHQVRAQMDPRPPIFSVQLALQQLAHNTREIELLRVEAGTGVFGSRKTAKYRATRALKSGQDAPPQHDERQSQGAAERIGRLLDRWARARTGARP